MQKKSLIAIIIGIVGVIAFAGLVNSTSISNLQIWTAGSISAEGPINSTSNFLLKGRNLTNAYDCVVSQDGTGDFNGSTDSPIRSCVSLVNNSGGGRVFVKNGNYNLSNQISLPSNVWIIGSGIDLTNFTVVDSTNILPFKQQDTTNGNTNIKLQGFTLDLNGANQISNDRVSFSGVSNSEIDHVKFKNPLGFALLWQQIGDPAPTVGIVSRNNRITNNIFSGGITANDRFVMNIQDSIIQGNTFTGSPVGSNYDLSTGRSARRNIIIGNVFNSSGQVGIGFEDSQYIQIIGNTFYNQSSNCIQIIMVNSTANSSDIIISDNYLNQCGTSGSGTGIRVVDTPNLKISNNIINGTISSCISASRSLLTKTSNVEIIENQLSNCGSSGVVADGINLGQISEAIVSDNIISYSTRDGIAVNNVNNSLISNNIVFNNHQNNSQTAPRGSGIISSGGSSQNLTIVDNLAYDNQASPTQRWGIFVSNGNGGKVTDNRGFGNTAGMLSIAGTNVVLWNNEGSANSTIFTNINMNSYNITNVILQLNTTGTQPLVCNSNSIGFVFWNSTAGHQCGCDGASWRNMTGGTCWNSTAAG